MIKKYIFSKTVYFFIGFFLGIFLIVNILGMLIGNTLYQMLDKQKIDYLVPALASYSENVSKIKNIETDRKWEHLSITADDGCHLAGTYIKNPAHTNKTVIILHGIYQNRAMAIDYVPLYQQLGFNVLLIDLRGHGESEGSMTWGRKETGDINAWIAYLQNTKNAKSVGIHGVSLGGAYALLHSGTAAAPLPVSFYVEDSSYADLSDIYREKLRDFLQLPQQNFIVDILSFYCQTAMYFHTGETMSDLSPLRAVAKTKSPILFLHGDADKLVSSGDAQKLYQADNGYKEIHIFPGAPHAVSISTNKQNYYAVIAAFLKNIGQN